MKALKLICFLLSLSSCTGPLQDSFESRKLISTKGENIYVNSINWGVTDDHQLSVISSNSDKLRQRADSVGAVKGLEPFIYSFSNDSLTLYFRGDVTYRIVEEFRTIIVTYKSLSPNAYNSLAAKSEKNSLYYSVPMERSVSYPPDMPKPKR
jgi:hypothetical protein